MMSNGELFIAINSIRSPLVDALMNFGTSLGNFWNMPWLIAALIIAQACSNQWGMFKLRMSDKQLTELIRVLFLGYVVCGLIVAALKFGLQVPRPSVLYGQTVIHSLEDPDSPYSLPSGHSAFAMLVAAATWRYCSFTLKIFVGLTVLWVGLSRINLGMHFPSDVLVGYVVGLFGVWCAHRVLSSRFSEPH